MVIDGGKSGAPFTKIATLRDLHTLGGTDGPLA